MSVLILLIAISLLVATGFLIAFLFSANAGQFDDSYTPSIRMLFDEVPVSAPKADVVKPPVTKKKNSLSIQKK